MGKATQGEPGPSWLGGVGLQQRQHVASTRVVELAAEDLCDTRRKAQHVERAVGATGAYVRAFAVSGVVVTLENMVQNSKIIAHIQN